jgi:hypothetical protein
MKQLALPDSRVKATGRSRSARPHIDPQWQRTFSDQPPTGARSRRRVECCACKDAHELRDRRMHNGTRSECPRCGEPVFSDQDEETT